MISNFKLKFSILEIQLATSFYKAAASKSKNNQRSLDSFKSESNIQNLRRNTRHGSKGMISGKVRTLDDKFDYYYKPYNLTDKQNTAHMMFEDIAIKNNELM